MLTHAGAQAQTRHGVDVHAAPKRGGGGQLKVSLVAGADAADPHFAVGTKDQDGSRIFYEPLASTIPREPLSNLAAEIPTAQNGGVAATARASPGS